MSQKSTSFQRIPVKPEGGISFINLQNNPLSGIGRFHPAIQVEQGVQASVSFYFEIIAMTAISPVPPGSHGRKAPILPVTQNLLDLMFIAPPQETKRRTALGGFQNGDFLTYESGLFIRLHVSRELAKDWQKSGRPFREKSRIALNKYRTAAAPGVQNWAGPP